MYTTKNKPKLVIIIDDVSNEKQKEYFKYWISDNYGFLPPTNKHKNSAQIANSIPFHIIHFPMQASSAFKGPEMGTLKITDSYEEIEARKP